MASENVGRRGTERVCAKKEDGESRHVLITKMPKKNEIKLPAMNKQNRNKTTNFIENDQRGRERGVWQKET